MNKKNQSKKLSIKPVGDRVLVRPFSDEAKGKTASGIYIPETSEKEKPEQGKVMAVGEGKYIDGKLTPLRVKVGDTVVFSKYGYEEITVEDQEYIIIKEENILAVIN